jgi:hypothetical protein
MSDEDFLKFVFSVSQEEVDEFYDSLTLKELMHYRKVIATALARKMNEHYDSIEPENFVEAKSVLKQIMRK